MLRAIARELRNLFLHMIEPLDMYVNTKNKEKELNESSYVKVIKSVTLTKEQEESIDNFYIKNYGKKIPYTWHRYYTAFTGNFTYDYFPEILNLSKFKRFMNMNNANTLALADKNFLKVFAKSVGVKTPETLLSCVDGLYQNGNGEILTKEEFLIILNNIGECFCKPSVDSYGGKECFVANIKNGIDLESKDSAIDIVGGLGNNFVIEKRLICHEAVAKLHPNSCNTFRIVTYRWKNEFYYCPVVMRIGVSGNFIDNISSGGICIAIEPDGTLHETAFLENNQRFLSHPTTGIKFANYKIEKFPLCVEAALRLHKAIPQAGLIDWDFTINEDGEPVVIEANVKDGGGISLSQLVHGRGVFGKRTAEILQWIGKLENLSLKKRKKYKFGKM